MSFAAASDRPPYRRGETLCRIDEIADPGGKGFMTDHDGERRAIFVMRQGARIFGYVNQCPHVGTPLDWQPDVFLSPDRTFIQCATHGALFRIFDGYCVAGPCRGRKLDAVKIEMRDGAVILA
ncbi:MAG: Rieske (2Fe-2S) protein [Alphaproteobacteria bacterium]|nr:Rieske (2Fe-2S) protein [Alphaproteobacteria bacterium]